MLSFSPSSTPQEQLFTSFLCLLWEISMLGKAHVFGRADMIWSWKVISIPLLHHPGLTQASPEGAGGKLFCDK